MRPSAAFLLVLFLSCAPKAPDGGNIYHGKLYGIFAPLKATESDGAIAVEGGTFGYTIDKRIGQIVSARALGEEFVAPGTSFPNPYIGLEPESDPGANQLGDVNRPRYGFEKAAEIKPLLWSGGLTNSRRYDAVDGAGIKTTLVESGPEFVRATSEGVFAGDGSPTPVSWRIDYLFDVDGLTKITVKLTTKRGVQLRWNCYSHALLRREVNPLLYRWSEPTAPPVSIGPEPVVSIRDKKTDEPVIESHFCPGIHLGNSMTGIEFFKMDFDDRWSGGHDGGDVVETADGRQLPGHDSRGRTGIFTQIFARGNALEYEEFDIRNSTHPLDPGEMRERTFWLQMTPANKQRDDLNSLRVMWPGPHQIRMAGWGGRSAEPWSPPSDEQVKLWAQLGINLIIGGANFFSGDYSHPTHEDKIRHFISEVHRYGMKVIPYVTFSDLNHAVPAFQTHSDEWKYSGSIEFRDFTTLMCFGAEGWREHWEKEVDSLLGRFEFDGLYIDHWVGTLLCANAKHGCGGYIGRFVVEGYHDFARRARRVVARHTDGEGIILLNSDSILFSGVIPWMDIRLNGEHWQNPDQIPSEALLSIWNGQPQGVQTLSMWRTPPKDNSEMIYFSTNYMFSFRYSSLPRVKSIEEWATPGTWPEIDMARLVWDVSRFFPINGSPRTSNFDSRGIIEMTESTSQANAFRGDGRALLVLGYLLPGEQAGKEPYRRETIRMLSPEKLGIEEGRKYRVVDINNNRYLDGRTYNASDLKAVPVRLKFGEPRFLLIEPEQTGPRLVFFRGADGVDAEVSAEKATFRIAAAPGSPIALHVETGGNRYRSLTPGVSLESVPGDFAVFSGFVPEDKTVVIGR